MSDRPVGVVLAGGASERMGVDKATLVVDGKPMAVRVADALWEAGCHPVESQGGDLAAMSEYGLDAIADRLPGRGPVGGIAEALARHGACDVIVAACDLVDLDAATVSAVHAAGVDSDADVAVVTSGGRRHLVSWWRRGLHERVESLLAEGTKSYLDVIDELRSVEVAASGHAVVNVNTPGDLQARG